MALHLDIALTPTQRETMDALPARAWFTQVVFSNASSPQHPSQALAQNNEMKQRLVSDWIAEVVPGKRVLDLFAANGAFSIIASRAGAAEVVGIEYSEDRLECARFLASTLPDRAIRFIQADVYELEQHLQEPFDIVLCLGGLYHVADPALILRKIRALTKETLLLQTAQVLDSSENVASFTVRRTDGHDRGLTSIRAGSGTWHYSPACLRELLSHGGFQVDEERQPAPALRTRFPWYVARCTPQP